MKSGVFFSNVVTTSHFSPGTKSDLTYTFTGAKKTVEEVNDEDVDLMTQVADGESDELDGMDFVETMKAMTSKQLQKLWDSAKTEAGKQRVQNNLLTLNTEASIETVCELSRNPQQEHLAHGMFESFVYLGAATEKMVGTVQVRGRSALH